MAHYGGLSFMETFALAGVASAVSATGTAPVERIKLLMQNQSEILKSGRLDMPYHGLIDCTKRTFRSEGFLPFWRGNTANVIRYFPNQALTLAFKDKIKDAFSFWKPRDITSKIAKNVISGSAAGVFSLIFVYPLDYARTRLANDTKTVGIKVTERQFNGIMDVYRKTFVSDGIRGLYRGFVISCAGIMVLRGITFGLFDTLRPIVMGDSRNILHLFALGYCVTMTSYVFYYPFDTIRRRMMMTSGEAHKYKGSLDCTVKMVKNEGLRSLFKGFTANVLRSITGGVVLTGYNKMEAIYIQWRLNDLSV